MLILEATEEGPSVPDAHSLQRDPTTMVLLRRVTYLQTPVGAEIRESGKAAGAGQADACDHGAAGRRPYG